MKTLLNIIIFLVVSFIVKNVQGQIPDTIYLELRQEEPTSIVLGLSETSGTSSTSYDYYVMYEGKIYSNLGETIITPIDRKFTKQEAIDYLVNLIRVSEEKVWYNQAMVYSNREVESLYDNINVLLDSLDSDGYYSIMLDKYGSYFKDMWILEYNGLEYRFNFTDTGVVFLVDDLGESIENTSVGAYLIKSKQRFILTNIDNLPTPITFNKTLNSDTFYNEDMTMKLYRSN